MAPLRKSTPLPILKGKWLQDTSCLCLPSYLPPSFFSRSLSHSLPFSLSLPLYLSPCDTESCEGREEKRRRRRVDTVLLRLKLRMCPK
jgi:hypothetical protein